MALWDEFTCSVLNHHCVHSSKNADVSINLKLGGCFWGGGVLAGGVLSGWSCCGAQDGGAAGMGSGQAVGALTNHLVFCTLQPLIPACGAQVPW